jgi:hypothetical protein
MSANTGSRGLSLPSSAQNCSNAKSDAHISQCGVSIHALGYAGPMLGTSSVLANYVDWMMDWDVACPDQALRAFLALPRFL